MDAKPQRPIRPIHHQVQGDENMPLAPTTQSSGLQHHKSTGNLGKMAAPMVSNMATAGGLKAAAKRTTLGDVSNTTKNMQSRDELVIVGQPSDCVKPLLVTDKSAGFSRPAQRPLNAAPARLGQVNVSQPAASTSFAQVSIPTKVSLGQETSAPAAIKRTTSKRTAVFKDNDENQVPMPIATAPVHQTLGPRQHKSQPQLVQEHQPVIPRLPSKPVTNDALAGESAVGYTEEIIADEEAGPGNYDEHLQMPAQSFLPNPSAATQQAVAKLHKTLPQQHIMSESEEYWPEEDEEEMYEEAGYTTGGATTGGATTVFFPQNTTKDRKELAAAKDAVETARTPEEVEDDMWDTSMVAEYSEEIFAYMRELEMKMLPNAQYMDNQSEIQWSMRAVLMDWLVQVHARFTLLPETLFLCVNYVDRFLSSKIVSLGKLQLVGATAIFVAAKYEEINCPSVSEIVFMVDGGYTTDEILKAERFMLSMLQFELGWPGPYSFLRRISKADEYDLETRTLAKYFLEVAIMDERLVGSPASYIAAGSHCLSRFLLHKGDWSQAHVHYSGYTWAQIKPLVTMLLECCDNPEKHHNAVFEKFSDRRYKRTAIFVQSEIQKGFHISMIRQRSSLSEAPGIDHLEQRMIPIKA